jgi:DNA-binding MarR family transcriptional regulator
MDTPNERKPELCNCEALRQATRHVTQFYDRCLAPSGLRVTQFSILVRLSRLGPMTIGVLADAMVVDRTTLGRNIRPLEREGLIAVMAGRDDRRSRELRLTAAGAERLKLAVAAWTDAQARFEAVFGRDRTLEVRALMRALTDSDFGPGIAPAS